MAVLSPLEMTEAAVRADVETSGSDLVALRDKWTDIDDDRRSRIINNTLRACAYDGPGALDAGQVLRLVAPLRAPLSDDTTRAGASGLLDAIARRTNVIAASRMLAEILNDYGASAESSGVDHNPPSTGTEERADSAGKSEIDFAGLAAGGIGSLPDELTLSQITTEWLHEWSQTDLTVAHSVNTWLLRTAIFTRRPLPIEFCDRLRTDDGYWSSDSAGEMAASLGLPFPPDVIGELGAACLNSRLRKLRPRLFLTHADTVIIAPISEPGESDTSADAMLEEIGYPLLRCFMTIQAERNRDREGRPRKGTMKELEGYLEDVLRRFGVVLVGQVGETIDFDPATHRPLEAVEPGEPVVVVQPGLKQRSTALMQIPVTVRSASQPEPYGSDSIDQPEADDDQ